MKKNVWNSLAEAKKQGRKKFAVLIDPDEMRLDNLDSIVHWVKEAQVDYFFVGGSLVVDDQMTFCLETLRRHTNLPLILFPGSPQQINPNADAILLLSLISGRNPDLLIGQHVLAAPALQRSGLEVMPTGYILVDGGKPTTASYISNTQPIPADKPEIAYCTALAGEFLGLKTMYLDAGSGAKNPIPEAVIAAVAKGVSVPIIVGGGIRTPERAYASAKAGADVIVVGNALEKDPKLALEISQAIQLAGLNHSIRH
ncbi:MAG: hypothetical protein RL757_1886 [Bacteroidota bacterium]|jgi:putative glycerol-1-phosphate prenyltransferase